MEKKQITRREFFKLTGMGLAAGTWALNCGTRAFAAPGPIPFGTVRFAVIADTHLDTRGKNAMKMSAVSVDCVRKTVEALNREPQLQFVVLAGDLLLDGEWENARVLKTELDRLKAPYYVVAGNHDFIPPDPKKHRQGFTYMTIEEFVDFFQGHGYDESKKRYYARQIVPGLRLIGMDACLVSDPKKWGGVLPHEQMAWLDEQLAGHEQDLHILVMHHNFLRWSGDERKGGPKEWFCVDNDEAVRNLLSKHAKAAPVAISAHRHIGLNTKEVRGVNYFIAPSVNSHPMRYTVFSITNQRISWKTPMVPVPETVHLEARENLLNAKWWRASQYSERSASNDQMVLRFYENDPMIFGSKKV
ncbi:Tat pathway signal sequence domain protein [delta proteobacterium NaphS2]|nr:Tat pathway signal sequence domain protein [delta proteobacterium NaphS2]